MEAAEVEATEGLQELEEQAATGMAAMAQLRRIIKIREVVVVELGILLKAETLASLRLALEEQGIVQEVVVPAYQLIKRETLAIA
jgi:hypothetical protein